MSKIYSTYEAKARFSEIMRQVREGRSVTITYRGQPTAEIRPLEELDDDVGARLDRLEARGALVRASGAGALKPVRHCPGALNRFLQDRDD